MFPVELPPAIQPVMVRTPSWWRRLGAALAALVVAVLAFGPGLDGLICGDEAGLAAVAVTQGRGRDARNGRGRRGGGGVVAMAMHAGAAVVVGMACVGMIRRDGKPKRRIPVLGVMVVAPLI